MAQQKHLFLYASPAIACVAWFSQPVYAQGWYGGPYYGSQAPWTAPPGYHRRPASAAARPPDAAAVQKRDTLQLQLASSQQQLHNTRNELQRTQMLLQQARAALEREQSSMHQRGSMQHTFSNQLTHLSSQQDEVYAQMKRLTDEVSSLKAPLIDNRAQIADIAAIARALNEERDRLQGSLDGQDEQLSALRSEIQAAQDALEHARSDTATIRDGLVKADPRSQSCESQISVMKEKLQDAIFDSDTSRQALNDTLAAREKLQAALSRCTVKLAQVQAARKTGYSAPATAVTPASKAAAPATKRQTENVAMMTAEAIPGADRDGDGVPNDADFCPQTPDGVAVGPTGCDVPLPIVLEGVSFHSNSHQMNEDSYVVLDGVAGTLARYPELRLEVADFTHTQASPAFNRSLSQQRAETIMEYLVGRGISADRLTAHGYGTTRPASDGKQSAPILPGQPVTLRKID